MCLRCAQAVVLARTPELPEVAAVTRMWEALGSVGAGESVDVRWAERKAWDEVAATKIESERVEGWVEGGQWRAWREAREGLV